MIILYVIFIISIGLLMSIRPDIVWLIKESWKSGDATEPSDLYIKITRFGGIVFLIIAAIGIIVYIFV